MEPQNQQDKKYNSCSKYQKRYDETKNVFYIDRYSYGSKEWVPVKFDINSGTDLWVRTDADADRWIQNQNDIELREREERYEERYEKYEKLYGQ